MDHVFVDPQYPTTVDDFTRPIQSRQVVKDIYKQQVCANSQKKGRTSYVNGKKSELSNDYAKNMYKQEQVRKNGPNSILLGTARLESISGKTVQSQQINAGLGSDDFAGFNTPSTSLPNATQQPNAPSPMPMSMPTGSQMPTP